MNFSSCSWWKALVVGAGCAVLGYHMGNYQRRSTAYKLHSLSSEGAKSDDVHEVQKLAEIIDDFKMVLVVRKDLNMSKEKIVAQCSDATLGLYKEVFYKAPKALDKWETCDRSKAVAIAESEEELLRLQSKAMALKLPVYITIDADNMQVAPNTRTVMAILGPSDIVDEVTEQLNHL